MILREHIGVLREPVICSYCSNEHSFAHLVVSMQSLGCYGLCRECPCIQLINLFRNSWIRPSNYNVWVTGKVDIHLGLYFLWLVHSSHRRNRQVLSCRCRRCELAITKELTAERRQFVVSKWTVFDSVTHPFSVDTSSVCAAVLMTLTRYVTNNTLIVS